MKLGILLLILFAVVSGSGYWYAFIDRECKTPVYYRIGNIDERFGTSKDELQRIAKNAELIWENRLMEELFIYDEGRGLPINLVFDERQRNSEIERELRYDLNAKEGMSDGVASQYEELISEFRSLKKDYEKRVVVYESELRTYNTTVTKWNEKGGALKNKIEELKLEQNRLVTEQKTLETRAKELNSIASKLNVIGAKGNTIITDYNKIVEEYNIRFSKAHEYTQGDQSVKEINVYQFNTEEELTLVLAHEMGHALSIGHVSGEQSIMYKNMGAQQVSNGLSTEDVTEFNNMCSGKSLALTLITFFQNLF